MYNHRVRKSLPPVCAVSAGKVITLGEKSMGRKGSRVYSRSQTKRKGLLIFFAHLSNGHKGIACALAMEPVPVRATFPSPVSSVTAK
jgi:hypothetical protein